MLDYRHSYFCKEFRNLTMFKGAGTPEVIRAHQKDDNIQHHLRSSASDIMQSILGPRIWIQWRQHIDLAANITYFLLTTLSDLQTVGEEYVNIIQTNHTLKHLPSKWRRAAMVALQVCAPFILQRTLTKFEHQLQTSGSLPVRPSTRKVLLSIIPLMRKATSLVHRLHLATFYIQGIYYHLAKRFAGIHYIQISSGPTYPNQNRPFRILGYLSLVQIFLSCAIYLYKVVIEMRKQKTTDSLIYEGDETTQDRLAVPPNEKCPLCLGKRVHTTLTPCGHLYCWNCILEWCMSKQECPLCRDQFPPQRLIVLQNYAPS